MWRHPEKPEIERKFGLKPAGQCLDGDTQVKNIKHGFGVDFQIVRVFSCRRVLRLLTPPSGKDCND